MRCFLLWKPYSNTVSGERVMEGSVQGPFFQGYQLSNLFSHNEFFLFYPNHLTYSVANFFLHFLHYFKYIFIYPWALYLKLIFTEMRRKGGWERRGPMTSFSSSFLYDVQKSPLKPSLRNCLVSVGRPSYRIHLPLRKVVLVCSLFTCLEEG